MCNLCANFIYNYVKPERIIGISGISRIFACDLGGTDIIRDQTV